jgi:hypothetical protein
MDVTKPYKSIYFGAMDIAKPYKLIGFGAMDVTKKCKCICFSAMDFTKLCEIYTLWGHGCHQTQGNLHALGPCLLPNLIDL